MNREYRITGPATCAQIIEMCREAQADHESAERYRLTMLDAAEGEIDRQIADLRQAHANNIAAILPKLVAALGGRRP